MTKAPTRAALIAQAQTFVRRGATIRVDMTGGFQHGPYPVAFMSLTRRMLWFLWAGDDHAHGAHVDWIKPGDEGQVLVSGDDGEKLVTIWGTTKSTEADHLERWLEGTRRHPEQLPVGPPPPDIVQYEGRLDEDTWRRWRGQPGRGCTVRVVEVSAKSAHGIIEEVEGEIGPDQAHLDFALDSVPADWQPLRRGDRLTACLHRHEGKLSGWQVTWGMSRISAEP